MLYNFFSSDKMFASLSEIREGLKSINKSKDFRSIWLRGPACFQVFISEAVVAWQILLTPTLVLSWHRSPVLVHKKPTLILFICGTQLLRLHSCCLLSSLCSFLLCLIYNLCCIILTIRVFSDNQPSRVHKPAHYIHMIWKGVSSNP